MSRRLSACLIGLAALAAALGLPTTGQAHTRRINGWCEKDKVGIAGHFSVDDRKEFDELARAYSLVLAAVEKSAQCESCAGAMITDGYCRIHNFVLVERVRAVGRDDASGRPGVMDGEVEPVSGHREEVGVDLVCLAGTPGRAA